MLGDRSDEGRHPSILLKVPHGTPRITSKQVHAPLPPVPGHRCRVIDDTGCAVLANVINARSASVYQGWSANILSQPTYPILTVMLPPGKSVRLDDLAETFGQSCLIRWVAHSNTTNSFATEPEQVVGSETTAPSGAK